MGAPTSSGGIMSRSAFGLASCHAACVDEQPQWLAWLRVVPPAELHTCCSCSCQAAWGQAGGLHACSALPPHHEEARGRLVRRAVCRGRGRRRSNPYPRPWRMRAVPNRHPLRLKHAWHQIQLAASAPHQLHCVPGVCIFALTIMLLLTCCLQHVPLTCCYVRLF